MENRKIRTSELATYAKGFKPELEFDRNVKPSYSGHTSVL